MKILIAFVFAITMFTLMQCSSSRTASYRYTEKQLEHGQIDFDRTIKPDEYLNAFAQDPLKLNGQDLVLAVHALPVSKEQPDKRLYQVAVRTRGADSLEKAKPSSLCLVLDRSGSMNSDHKISDAKLALAQLVQGLRTGDEFALVLFNNEARIEIPSTRVNDSTRVWLLAQVEQIRALGGTDIDAGLALGYQTLQRMSYEGNRRLLLLTDGRSNVGATDPREIARATGTQYLEDARISTIGLGIDVDQDLLRIIAEQGRGHYYFAENAQALGTLFTEELRSVIVPVATDLHLRLQAGPGESIEAVYGVPEATQGKAQLAMDELNADDWRIVLVETQVQDRSAKPVNFSATLRWRSVGAIPDTIREATRSVSDSTNSVERQWVVRNGILFANAYSLIEIGKLARQERYAEASKLADLQLQTLHRYAQIYESIELQGEEKRFKQVSSILEKSEKPQESRMLTDTTESIVWRQALEAGVRYAVASLPGIWGTVGGIVLDLALPANP